MAETERFPGSIGPWHFQANGTESKLSLTDDGTGSLSGTFDGSQQVIGFWDADAQRVTFLRICNSSDPTSVQVYTGYLSSHGVGIDEIGYDLLGSYQAFSGSGINTQKNVFGWSASMTRPVG